MNSGDTCMNHSRCMSTRVLIALVVAASCTKPRVTSVVKTQAMCDATPPKVTVVQAAQIPTISAGVDRGAIAGTVVEAGTGQPLVAVAGLYRPDSPAVGSDLALSDSLGRFVIRAAPGTYVLRLRLIGHRVGERRVELRAGVVDTVRVEMRSVTCVGG